MFIFQACDFLAMFRDRKTNQGSLKLPHDITRGEAMVDANYIVIRDLVPRRSQVSDTNNLR